MLLTGVLNIYQRLVDRSHNQTAAFMHVTVAHVTRITSGNPSALNTLNCPLQVAGNDGCEWYYSGWLRQNVVNATEGECGKRIHSE